MALSFALGGAISLVNFYWLKRSLAALVDAVALAVGDGDELRIRKDHNALRLAKSRHALDVLTALQIEHFHRVVPECRDVQSLPGSVDRKMIDAAFDATKINRADKGKRRRT